MSLVPTSGKSKKFYTRKEDETIIAMSKEGKNAKEIGAKIGHTEASVNYRITRVLNKEGVKSLDDIKYKV